MHWGAELPDTINRTYIDQASYWLTYFPYVPVSTFVQHHTHLLFSVAFFFRLRGFLVLFDLAQIINLVWIFIKKQYVHFLCKTRNERRTQCDVHVLL